MKKTVLTWLLCVALISYIFAQEQNVHEKLQNFFFSLPFNSDIEVVRATLGQLEEFRFYSDPNRDAARTILGTFSKNKRLNPAATDNQLIIMYWGTSAKRKNVSMKWAINYKLEDLATGLNDYEKMILEFKPYFTDVTEKREVGQHKEEILIAILKKDIVSITIRMIEYNNFIHTVSIEYRDVWKIPTTSPR